MKKEYDPWLKLLDVIKRGSFNNLDKNLGARRILKSPCKCGAKRVTWHHDIQKYIDKNGHEFNKGDMFYY